MFLKEEMKEILKEQLQTNKLKKENINIKNEEFNSIIRDNSLKYQNEVLETQINKRKKSLMYRKELDKQKMQRQNIQSIPCMTETEMQINRHLLAEVSKLDGQ